MRKAEFQNEYVGKDEGQIHLKERPTQILKICNHLLTFKTHRLNK